jgi:5'-3' exoribonuclease 2
MLALATYEPHFRVLREDVFAQDKKMTCRICGHNDHHAAQCPDRGDHSATQQKPTDIASHVEERKLFVFLNIAILREYLRAELQLPNQTFPFNMEQAVGDWVFLIFFVGNDFLPHLPSLEIREGAIDTLVEYMEVRASPHGWLRDKSRRCSIGACADPVRRSGAL